MKTAPRKLDRSDFDGPDKAKLSPIEEKLLEAVNANADALSDVALGGVGTENLAKVQRRMVVAQMPATAPWATLALAPATDFGPPYDACAILMSPGGVVRLRGVAVTGGAGQIVELPTGHSPTADREFLCPTLDASVAARVTVDSGGIVSQQTAGANAGLDGISYVATSPCAAPYRFSGLGWPIIVRHDLEKVRGLVLEACRRRSTPSAPNGGEATGAPCVDWEDVGDGTVKIHAIWGLQWGRAYDVRVMLSAEE